MYNLRVVLLEFVICCTPITHVFLRLSIRRRFQQACLLPQDLYPFIVLPLYTLVKCHVIAKWSDQQQLHRKGLQSWVCSVANMFIALVLFLLNKRLRLCMLYTNVLQMCWYLHFDSLQDGSFKPKVNLKVQKRFYSECGSRCNLTDKVFNLVSASLSAKWT